MDREAAFDGTVQVQSMGEAGVTGRRRERIGCVVLLAPWHFPSTAYRKLMLTPNGIFVISTIWAVWAFGGQNSEW